MFLLAELSFRLHECDYGPDVLIVCLFVLFYHYNMET